MASVMAITAIMAFMAVMAVTAVMGAGAAAQVGAQLESLVQAGGGLVEGTVQRVTFRADDTGYTVLQVKVAHATGLPPALAAAAAAPAAPPAKAGGRARRSAGARWPLPEALFEDAPSTPEGTATRLLQPRGRPPSCCLAKVRNRATDSFIGDRDRPASSWGRPRRRQARHHHGGGCAAARGRRADAALRGRVGRAREVRGAAARGALRGDRAAVSRGARRLPRRQRAARRARVSDPAVALAFALLRTPYSEDTVDPDSAVVQS